MTNEERDTVVRMRRAHADAMRRPVLNWLQQQSELLDSESPLQITIEGIAALVSVILSQSLMLVDCLSKWVEQIVIGLSYFFHLLLLY